MSNVERFLGATSQKASRSTLVMSCSPVVFARSVLARSLGCLAAILVAGMLNISIQAQPPGGFRGGPGGPGGGAMFGGPVALLQREDVQQELELLEDQKTQLKAMNEKTRERMGELFRGQRGGAEGNDRRDELRETFRKFNEETQAEVDKILLPHQSKRLQQLEVQMRMRGGVMGALGGDVAEKLGISEEQRDKLREKAQGLEQELRKKMAEVRKQMQDQLLAELSPEQRKQFNDMVGDPFEFKDEAPPPGGFGGRGEGGPGGNRESRGGNDRRRRPDEQK
jgi:Spy/CpxP family protein refolding chaperone